VSVAPEHESPSERARAAGIPAAAALLASSVLLSRVIGYVREALLAYHVGATGRADAYYAGFQLPDLLNHLLAAGALSIAFLPFYVKRREESEAAADRLLATMLGTLGFVALLVTAAMWAAAEWLVVLQFPSFDAELRELTTRLTRIVLPGQIFFVVGGVVQASLLARGRFAAAALAPLVYNVCIVLGGVLLAPSIGVEGFSWGALVGAALGPFGVPWLDARRRVRVGARVAPFDRDFLHYVWLAAPLVAGMTLLTVDEWYARWFGARVGEGAIAALSYARRLMLAPVAVVGQALGAAAQPALANLWAAGRRDELDRVVGATLRTALALGCLTGAASLALASPLVRFVYERGAFDASDAAAVAGLLAIMSFTVPAWVVQQIVVRAFYARGDTWRPMLIGTAFALAAIPLYWFAGERYGARGIALAGVVAMSANALGTVWIARRLHGGPALLPIAASGLRALAIAAAAGAVARACLLERPGFAGVLLDLAIGGAVFAAVTGVGVALIGDAALRESIARVWQGVRRRAGRARS